MNASRLSTCLCIVLLVATLALPASADDAAGRVLILDGGKSWAFKGATGLEVLPIPAADVLLHKAVSMETGHLAVGIEFASRAGTAVERLVLLQNTADGVELLPAPKQLHDRVTHAPAPVMVDGALSGLVWIEGFAPNQTRVLASDWTGSGWSQPVAVSNFGPGTQIALDLARLSDGSLLAVWAAFDGEDDEIVWSRSAGGASGPWSTPRPISENAVPDVTPTLHATADGALIAWSGYDGNDYRIQLSHFAEGSWSLPTLLEGRGAVWPQFQSLGGERAALTWRQAVPATWMVASVDGIELLWTAPVELPETPGLLKSHPLVEADGSALSVRWPNAGGPAEEGVGIDPVDDANVAGPDD